MHWLTTPGWMPPPEQDIRICSLMEEVDIIVATIAFRNGNRQTGCSLRNPSRYPERVSKVIIKKLVVPVRDGGEGHCLSLTIAIKTLKNWRNFSITNPSLNKKLESSSSLKQFHMQKQPFVEENNSYITLARNTTKRIAGIAITVSIQKNNTTELKM